MFVLDTSVAVSWCFEDEVSDATDEVLDRLRAEPAAVPPIWPLEVANVLLGAERRQRLSEAESSRFLALLDQLPISVDDTVPHADAVLAAGRRHGLTSYDASYLLLAERLGTPLATLDRTLARAAGTAGVPLLIDLG